MKLLLIFLFFSFLPLGYKVLAQENLTDCTIEVVSQRLEGFLEQAQSNGEVQEILLQLQEFSTSALTSCVALDTDASISSETEEELLEFTSDEYGLQAVIGPIRLPSGMYRVTAITLGFMIADLEVLGGTCETGLFGLFNLSRGEATNGASSILISDNCEALITTSNARENWRLVFDRLDLNASVELQDRYTSEEYGQKAVIGPIIFPTGRYRVIATTNGFIIADIVVVNGDCETGPFRLFNISRGQATNGATSLLRSSECVAFLTVDNARESWVIEFAAIG